MASAYDAEGGSQFRAILLLPREDHPSLYQPYGSIDGIIAEALAT
jgi:hypothetical protein